MKLEDVLERGEDTTPSVTAQTDMGIQSDAVQALTDLGYGSAEALKAVKKVTITEEMQVEDVLKQALKNMMF